MFDIDIEYRFQQARPTQRDWNVNLRDLCNEVACLVKAYRDRASELQTY